MAYLLEKETFQMAAFKEFEIRNMRRLVLASAYFSIKLLYL
jgi:hypothetical protein